MWKNISVAVLATMLVLPAQPASALENEDLLALVAMPLAVAAVSEVADVPMHQLMDVVTLLNDAAVPPPQFIEVVRYVPVALVTEADGPDFVEFVRLRRDEGLVGTALVTSIEERMRVYDLEEINLDVTRTRIVDVTDDFVPAIVRTRVAEARTHPHGGPPGQLKKAAGVQTGAEIVHGSTSGRPLPDQDRREVVTRVDDDRRILRRVENHDDAPRVSKGKKAKPDDAVSVSRGGGKAKGHGRHDDQDRGGKGNKGEGNGKGKGKG